MKVSRKVLVGSLLVHSFSSTVIHTLPVRASPVTTVVAVSPIDAATVRKTRLTSEGTKIDVMVNTRVAALSVLVSTTIAPSTATVAITTTPLVTETVTKTVTGIVTPTVKNELTTRQQIIRNTENILMNPFLEKIRLLEQVDNDEINESNTNKIILLYPIISIQKDLTKISTLIRTGTLSNFLLVSKIINQEQYQVVTLKKIFNRYSDNIFYSDPRRANLYLAGGAVPNSRQTEQYLQRNDIITNLINVQDDINSVINDQKNFFSTDYNGNDRKLLDNQLLSDIMDDCSQLLQSYDRYIQLADPEDVRIATKVYDTTLNEQK